MGPGLLGFVHVVTDEKPIKFFGGLLVVDMSGDPKEFRCTAPVQPTMLQQMLWGENLRRHIVADLLLAPLVKAVELLPNVIIVQQRDFLHARRGVSLPIILVRRASTDPQPVLLGLETVTTQLSLGPDNREEYILECFAATPADLEVSQPLLVDFCKNCFLLEPFKRIEQAITLLKQRLEKAATS